MAVLRISSTAHRLQIVVVEIMGMLNPQLNIATLAANIREKHGVEAILEDQRFGIGINKGFEFAVRVFALIANRRIENHLC